MKILIDTHTLFWSVDDPAKVSAVAMAAIQPLTNDVLLSAASIWELAIKVGLGKMSLSLPYRQWMEKAITDLKLMVLPVTVEYADRQSLLPPHHKDPFDRLMIAQALVERIPIASADAVFDPYGVTRIW
ncbi:MAG TPA: type II toxin-antitoxin system VapC family toxin [Gemmataceae bacterium]|nr:type II toxin-antitoxin system VapC family toxin [Gemmataceae bacterium]